MAYLQNMTPKALQAAVAENRPLLIGVGTIEYHGSQLPLGTDLMIVEGVLREMEKRADVVVAPPFIYSPNGYAVSGPELGTVDISVDCFINHVAEILTAYSRMGFRDIRVFVHHQGGSIGKFVETAALRLGMYNQQNILGDGWWTDKKTAQMANIRVCAAVIGDAEIRDAFGGHGGKGETQAIMATYPETVKLEELTDHEAWWNATVTEANPETAKACFERLIQLQVEALK